ncbi:MAG: hypothetical protein ALAOOOJD_01395 [bacterium]|nr:hypothetical protein [bacterium]
MEGIRFLQRRLMLLGMAAFASVSVSTLLAQTSQTPANFKVAFIGDQGTGANAIAVLNLIKNEGAQTVVHSGDFDYGDNAAAWDNLITSVLGANFPYFASIGNHDKSNFYGASGYQSFLIARMNRLGITWDGDLGVKSSFNYSGIFFVLTAPGVTGSGHDIYIRDKLAVDNSIWSISSWHKNMKLMQVGDKGDDTGWPVYEEARKGGAIIATAHEHSYSRTHLLSSCQNQTVASTSNTLVLAKDDANTPADEGRSFVFVSGLGGKSIRSQKLSGAWWASIYTSTQNATYGALFGEFNYNGQPDMARFYFKAINGAQPDAFFVRSSVAPPPAPVLSSFSPLSGAIGTAVTIIGSSFNTATQVAFNGMAASSFTIASDTEIQVEVPAGATSGKITVTNPSGTATSADDFVLTPPLPPGIVSFNPTNGVVGTQVTITGANFTGATQVAFNGVAASTVTVMSNSSLRADVPAGATTGKISVTAPGGTAMSADDFTVTPPPQNLIFNPTADAYINSANRTQNNGSATTLRLQKSSTVLRSYLKFVVSGLTATVQSAKLRLRVTVASNSGGSVYTTSNNYRSTSTPWLENGINATNAPNFTGSALGTVGSVTVGQWVEWDVTPALTGNGTFSFGMQNNSATTVQYSSKEGADKPQLVLQMNAAAAARELPAPAAALAQPLSITAQKPERVTLAPSYPNPFNAQTVIEYALPEETPVHLGIYNVMGQRVRLLIHETQTPGYKLARWNGRDDSGREVSSGVYLYRLQVGPQTIVRKVTLQK